MRRGDHTTPLFPNDLLERETCVHTVKNEQERSSIMDRFLPVMMYLRLIIYLDKPFCEQDEPKISQGLLIIISNPWISHEHLENNGSVWISINMCTSLEQ